MINKPFGKIIDSLLYLLYPELCMGCGNSLVEGEKVLCAYCEGKLPRTRFHDDDKNMIQQLFWGRAIISKATSFLFFRRKGLVQQLMHQFKYKNEREVGAYLGKLFAQELTSSEAFSSIDCIVPVPLHPDKEKKRGYNQSEVIGAGMAEVFGVPMYTSVLRRKIFTKSQTKKARYERWENVSSVFEVSEKETISNKHILLIDDVVTTGATLEACAQKLIEEAQTEVSIATLAVAYN